MILEFINHIHHNELLNMIVSAVTMLGWMYISMIIAVLLIIIGYYKNNKHMRNDGVLLFISLLATSIIVEVIKLIVARPRPYTIIPSLIVLAQESNLSFPSGHTATATVLAYCLSCEYGHRWIFMIIPLIVAFSRLYMGVHYPSDVLFGFLFALIISWRCEYILKKWNII